MKFFCTVLIIIFALLVPKITFATSTPIIKEPLTNTETDDLSPRLTWEYTDSCPETGNCFLVEVAANESFSLTEKSTYTNNTTYSPTLSEGKWYWRVKAKDSTNNWSNFSEVANITIKKQLANPSSSPTPSPTTKPSATTQPQNQGTPEKERSEFNISLNKNSIDSSDQITIMVSLKNHTPNTIYYIKPSFYQSNSTNYFGLTSINSEWIKNSITATSQTIITTDSSGNWSGSLTTKPDTEDSGFKGSGEYLLKVGKYNDSGTGLTWSNNTTVNINHIEKTPESKTDDSPINIGDTTTETILGTSDQNNIDEETLSDTTENESTAEPEINYQIATISANSTEDKTEVNNQQTIVKADKQFNWWFISAGMILLLVSAIYVVYQRKKLYYA